MFDRRQVSHENLWIAVVKSPLALFYFVGPFFAGVLISPLFSQPVSVMEWLYAAFIILMISFLIYINGMLGAFFFGIPLYYFLNAVRFQNKWVYMLVGFSGGTIFNLLYPWYSDFLYEGGRMPVINDMELAKVAIASYPIIFGLFGALVARKFWQVLAEQPAGAARKAAKKSAKAEPGADKKKS